MSHKVKSDLLVEGRLAMGGALNLTGFVPGQSYVANDMIASDGSLYIRKATGVGGASLAADSSNWTKINPVPEIEAEFILAQVSTLQSIQTGSGILVAFDDLLASSGTIGFTPGVVASDTGAVISLPQGGLWEVTAALSNAGTLATFAEFSYRIIDQSTPGTAVGSVGYALKMDDATNNNTGSTNAMALIDTSEGARTLEIETFGSSGSSQIQNQSWVLVRRLFPNDSSSFDVNGAEIATGTKWTDDKEIYRKSYSVASVAATGDILIDATLTSSYVDSIVFTYGSQRASDIEGGNGEAAVPGLVSEITNGEIGIKCDATGLVARKNTGHTGTGATQVMNLTIEYTRA